MRPDILALQATMVAGSFVAGSSAAGGGAVAFPVLTLLLGASPADARDFALLIQSVGMTAASVFILRRRIPVDPFVLGWALLGGALALPPAALHLAPLLDPRTAKLVFATVWFAFALALRQMSLASDLDRPDRITAAGPAAALALVAVGALGGVLTGCFGSGADLTVFCFVVLAWGLCETVGTPTSVILMAGLSLEGAAMRLLTGSVAPVTLERWAACAPVVLLGAPFGAHVASRLRRRSLTSLLVAILTVQFGGALLVLRPGPGELLLLAAAGVAALVVFRRMARRGLARLRPPSTLPASTRAGFLAEEEAS